MNEAKEIELLKLEVELLTMKLEARDEILAAYRDALECFQEEKRLAATLHKADITAITKPKQTV